MTKDEIIRMARETGMEYHEAIEEMHSPMTDGVWLEDLERFAALVAAAERERLKSAAECFRMCEHKEVCNEKTKSNEAN